MVIYDDLLNGHKFTMILDRSQFDEINEHWNSEDKLLWELKDTPIFEGATRWSELKPIHFKLLIIRNVIHLDKLGLKEKQDVKQPIVKSLHNLIGGLIRSIEERTDVTIECLKIQRINVEKINFDLKGSLDLNEFEYRKPVECTDDVSDIEERIEKPSLKIVIDNTRNDNT